MPSFFKKIRQKSIINSKLTKYLAYAVGEIILVVIGILIAVQINNSNEDNKREKLLKNILKNVSYDLITDTTTVGFNIKIEEKVILSGKRIINKEINSTNISKCPTCLSVATSYRPMKLNTKGYEQLKNFIGAQENVKQKDSLSVDIVQFYTQFLERIEENNTMLKNEALQNTKDYQQFDWFVDWTQGNFTDEIITYFTTSEDYRKRVAIMNILSEKNHLPYIKAYYTNAKYLLEKIQQRLED